jgi:hypothetical protein
METLELTVSFDDAVADERAISERLVASGYVALTAEDADVRVRIACES